MRHIPACISEDTARKLFEEKSAWGALYSLLFPPPSSPELNLPRLELIYFPYYLVEIGVNSSKGPGTVLLSVEAWSGAFAFFEQEDTLVDACPEGAETFEPKLFQDKVQEIAKDELLKATMRRRSTQGEKPHITGILRCECILYPLWLYYFERRKGKISLLVRDAVVGAAIGNRTRNGILQAFVEQNKK